MASKGILCPNDDATFDHWLVAERPVNIIPRIVPFSEQGVTVEFGSTIDVQTNALVLAFAATVEGAAIPGVLDVVPTYCAVTIYFNPLCTDAAALTDQLLSLINTSSPAAETIRTTHRIPVCYGGDVGPDLIGVADHAGIAPSAVVSLHTSVIYRVYMIGFSPGFPYMGLVPDLLTAPRLATPRRQVAAGSVGIAGQQTGIYPQPSPGGWRIIGRTPVRLFDLTRPQPFLVAAGDQVQFIPIDITEFPNLSSEQA